MFLRQCARRETGCRYRRPRSHRDEVGLTRRWPGFLRGLTLCSAVTAAPIIAPDVPLIPLRRSTDKSIRPTGRSSPRSSRAASTGRSSPAPTGRWRPTSARRLRPFHFFAASAASPLSPAYVPDEEEAALRQNHRPRYSPGRPRRRRRRRRHGGSHCVGNGAAGPLHQVDARRTAGNCQTVGLRHTRSSIMPC